MCMKTRVAPTTVQVGKAVSGHLSLSRQADRLLSASQMDELILEGPISLRGAYSKLGNQQSYLPFIFQINQRARFSSISCSNSAQRKGKVSGEYWILTSLSLSPVKGDLLLVA